MKYLIWSYDYSHASAGPKALHRLCHELNEAGERAYVGPWATNPEWNTPTSDFESFAGDWIAVYPEIVRGNPWNAPHVARWVLNVPGKLGGDTTYALSEMVFTWSTDFTDAPLLHVPTVETDIYYDRGLPRSGSLFYVGKGSGRRAGAREITYEMRLDRYQLADELNRAEALYSFDDVTGMADLAGLCGCPVVMPSGKRMEPAGYREEYLSRQAQFPAQLREFIAVTQGALVSA
jgi:hypothetical protein